jgi:ketosteroid isomerase-like protein
MKNGQKLDVWVRWTACYRKIGGKWKVTHEHISVPFDLLIFEHLASIPHFNRYYTE